ncbi:histone-lysine N-methyltransferase SETMAR-like, partial [Octopus sinensis]|uniref:Histone-lysine N-methyltransferase SETMAR-like n=1 Tax=Octopus sinensis TaxID=2607531 RepID=A0A6P7TWG9_9MOLL
MLNAVVFLDHRGGWPVQQPRAGHPTKKIMLSVWWDIKGVIHCDKMRGKILQRLSKTFAKFNCDHVVGESTIRRWFAKFEAGEFSLKDDGRSGRPSTLDEDVLKANFEESSNITTRELAEELEVSISTAQEHLGKLGCISRYN